MARDPWPFPADTPLERARKVGQSYRTALMSVDPEHCRLLDQKAVEVGQGWVRPFETEFADLNQLMTPDRVAEMFTLDPRTVRMWGYRGHVKVRGKEGRPRYRLGDVIDYLAKTRQARQHDKVSRNV